MPIGAPSASGSSRTTRSKEIEGAVRAGRYRDEAARELVSVLKGRRDRILRAYFADTAPLESFCFRGRSLCFGGAGRGPAIDERDGFTRCVALSEGSGYRVAEIAVMRPGDRRPGRAVRVHFVDDGARGRRLVGLER